MHKFKLKLFRPKTVPLHGLARMTHTRNVPRNVGLVVLLGVTSGGQFPRVWRAVYQTREHQETVFKGQALEVSGVAFAVRSGFRQ